MMINANTPRSTGDKRGRGALLATLCLVVAGLSDGHRALAGNAEADTEQHYRGTAFVCTGVGESRRDPRWTTYPLKMEFAGAHGKYVGDVRVRVHDAVGNLVLEAHCLTPWVLADLPPGRYRVAATANGEFEREFGVAVETGVQTCKVIRYAEITEQ